MDRNRRDFLRTVTLGGAAGCLGLGGGAAQASHGSSADPNAVGVLVDLTKCSGCRQCEAACRKANALPELSEESLKDTSVFDAPRRPAPDALTVVSDPQSGTRGKPGQGGTEGEPVYVKLNCLHCVDPSCVSACLVGALRKDHRGPVTYDPWKCMGCRYCMVACPFEMPRYEYDKAFTPRVRKCTFCFDPKQDGPEELAIPACVKSCPKEALLFGRRQDLLQLAHDRIAKLPGRYVDHVYGEQEAGGTSWMFLSPVPFERLGFPTLPASATPRLAESIQHGVFVGFVPPIAWAAILGLTAWLTRPAEAPAEDVNGRVHREAAVRIDTSVIGPAKNREDSREQSGLGCAAAR